LTEVRIDVDGDRKLARPLSEYDRTFFKEMSVMETYWIIGEMGEICRELDGLLRR